MTSDTFAQIVTLIETARGFLFTPAERQGWFAILSPLGDDEAREGTLAALREVEGRLLPAHIWMRGIRAMQDRKVVRPALEAQNVTDEEAAENRMRIAEMARGIVRSIS